MYLNNSHQTDLVLVRPGSTDGEEERAPVYELTVESEHILRCKVNHGESPDAEVRIRAWKRDKLLGCWTVGKIEGLGLEGLKSELIHRRRVEKWKKAAAVKT